MATIGTLGVNIVTNISNFQAGILAAIQSLDAFVEKQIDLVATTTRAAERLGTTASNLGTLETMAKRAGGSVDVVDSAMSRFVRNLGSAAESSGKVNKAREAIHFLGLSLTDLQKMDKAEAVESIARAMDKVTNSTQRAFIETALFAGHGGVAGQQMDIILKQLADGGLARVRQRALETGEALSNLDSERVRMMSDDFNKLGSQIDGVGKILGNAVAPYVHYVIEGFLAWANAGGGVAFKIHEALHFIGDTIGWVINGVDLLIAAWYGFQSAVSAVALFVLQGPIMAMATMIDTIVNGFIKAANTIIDVYNSLSKSTNVGLQIIGADPSLIADTLAGKAGKGADHIDSIGKSGVLDNISAGVDNLSVKLANMTLNGAMKFTSHLSDWLSGKGHDKFVSAMNALESNFNDRAIGNMKNGNPEDNLIGQQRAQGGSFREINTSLVSALGLSMTAKQTQSTSDKTTHGHLKQHTDILNKILVKPDRGHHSARTSA